MSNAQTLTDIADAASHFADVSEVLVRERIDKLKAFRVQFVRNADLHRDSVTLSIDELIADAETDLARIGTSNAEVALDASTGRPFRETDEG